MGEAGDTDYTAKHKNSSYSLTCDQKGCNEKFATAKELRAHTAQHVWGAHRKLIDAETGKCFYQCLAENCTKFVNDRKALRKHLLIHQPRRFRCEVPGCGKAFYERTKLKRHAIVHSGEKKFVCDYPGCSKRFAYRTNLKNHMANHTGELRYKCTVPGCNQRFPTVSTRKGHMQHCKQTLQALASQPTSLYVARENTSATPPAAAGSMTSSLSISEHMNLNMNSISTPTSNHSTPTQQSSKRKLHHTSETSSDVAAVEKASNAKRLRASPEMGVLNLSKINGETTPSQGSIKQNRLRTENTISDKEQQAKGSKSLLPQPQHIHRPGLSNLPPLSIPNNFVGITTAPTTDSNNQYSHMPTGISPTHFHNFWNVHQGLQRSSSYSSLPSLSTPTHTMQNQGSLSSMSTSQHSLQSHPMLGTAQSTYIPPPTLSTPQHSLQSTSQHSVSPDLVRGPQQPPASSTPSGLSPPAQIQQFCSPAIMSPLPSPGSVNGQMLNTQQFCTMPNPSMWSSSRASTPNSSTGNSAGMAACTAQGKAPMTSPLAEKSAGHLLALHYPLSFPWSQRHHT